MRYNRTLVEYMRKLIGWAEENRRYSFSCADIPSSFKDIGMHKKASIEGHIQRITSTKDRTVMVWRIIKHEY